MSSKKLSGKFFLKFRFFQITKYSPKPTNYRIKRPTTVITLRRLLLSIDIKKQRNNLTKKIKKIFSKNFN